MDREHRELALQIDRLRVKRGWSQNKLADFAGVSRAQLSRILTGRQSPTYKLLLKIAVGLKVDVCELTCSRHTTHGTGRAPTT